MFEELENAFKAYDFRLKMLENRISELEKKYNLSQKLTYTVKEAAILLGVKETTIRTWISEHKLIAIQTGKIFLIPSENLLAFTRTM